MHVLQEIKDLCEAKGYTYKLSNWTAIISQWWHYVGYAKQEEYRDAQTWLSMYTFAPFVYKKLRADYNDFFAC